MWYHSIMLLEGFVSQFNIKVAMLRRYTTGSLTAPKALSTLLGSTFQPSSGSWDETDVFNRAPSVISYNKETDDLVLQENRTWVAGLSDEGGAGSFVAFVMKQLISPVAAQVDQLVQFANETVWGNIQHSEGDRIWGVRKSLFYHDPKVITNFTYDSSINWSDAWDHTEADRVDRAYDYVWASLLYFAIYQASRVQSGLVSEKDALGYLEKAGETVNFGLGNNTSGDPNTLYSDLGLMGESVWGSLLEQLRLEHLSTLADQLGIDIPYSPNNVGKQG